MFDANKRDYQIYTLDGKQVSNIQKGLNIIRSNDGNVQKILVK